MSMPNEHKLLLLGLLRQTDMHGYMLNAHLDSTIPVTLKKPTAYNLLDVMEKDGWITHRNESSGKRTRKVYRITELGEVKYLTLLRHQLSAFTPGEYPGMVSICFLDSLSVPESIGLLKDRQWRIREYISGFHGPSNHPPDPDTHHRGSATLAIDFIHRTLKLEMTFLDEVIKTLQDSTKK
jgi:DNA-binding PadR family transcriptional regulator